MIRTLCIFLPLFTCVLWLIAHRLFCRRIDTAPQLFSLLLFESLFLFYDCCYADVLAPKHLQAISVLMAQAATPCLVPLCIIYLRKLRGIRTSHPLHLLWAVLPAALLTSAIIFYILAGPDNIEHALQAYYSGGLKAIDALSGDVTYLFFLSAFYVYRIVVYVLVVLFVFYLVFYYRKCSFKAADLHNFFFKSGDVPVCQLQFFNLSLLYAFMAVKALIIKDLVNSHPWSIVFFSVAMTVLIYSFCYIAMFGARQTIRISDLGDAWRYNYGTDSKGEVLARMLNSQIDESGDEAIILLQERFGPAVRAQLLHESQNTHTPGFTTVSDYLLSAVPESREEEKLLSSLQRLMLEKKVFLQPRIALGDVARMLDSNTSYVSHLVNTAYKTGFPEFINTLRIEYAEEYILNHRESKQQDIAANCGFLSASTFNNTFKKITGMTPKIWLASIDREKDFGNK